MTQLQATFGEEYGLPTLDIPVRDRIECAGCSELHNPDNCTEVPTGDVLCEDCFCDDWACCQDCDEIINREDVHSSDDHGGCYCESCFDERFVRCESCNHTVRRNNAESHGRYHYCETCFSEQFGTCYGCDNYFHYDDLTHHGDSDEYFCFSCYPNDDDEDDYSDSEACGAKPFRRSSDDTCHRIGSLRTFGVELETSKCAGYADLDGRTHFSSRSDGSISGLEFVSEVLRGDRGLTAISEFCRAAGDFEVNDSCGFHLHVGVIDLNDDQRRAVCVGYALTEALWLSLVPENRRNNRYCRKLAWSANDVADCDDFSTFAEQQCRYQWFNVAAYAEHCTFEVRLHSATLDGDKVCNWTEAHVKFIDWCARQSLDTIVAEFSGCTDQQRFERICAIWGNDDLARFYQRRAEKFGTSYWFSREMVAA